MENFVLVDLGLLDGSMEVPDSVDHSFDSLERFDSINCIKKLFFKNKIKIYISFIQNITVVKE